MNIEDINKRVEAIRGSSWDDESAHSAEDKLREDFIRYIADAWTGNLALMANAVLKTNDIKFARWCA